MAVKKRGRVHVDRPAFPALALAFLVTALIVYLASLSIRDDDAAIVKSANASETGEIALSGGDYWFVTLGAFDTQEECRIASARYLSLGASGYEMKREGKYVLIGNVYKDAQTAEKIAERIRESGIPADVFSISEEDATFFVTGKEDVLSAFTSLSDALIKAENALLSVSQRLDAGTLDKREAGAILSIIQHDLKKDRETIEKSVVSGIGGGMADLYLDAVSAMKDAQKTAGGEMYFSARIKHTALSMIFERLSLLERIRS